VQRFVARRVTDPYFAADLTAEVFLAAIDSAHADRRGAPIGWLFGTARNVVAAELRRSAREHRARSRVAAAAELVEPPISPSCTSASMLRRNSPLYLAMDRLSSGERAVLEFVAAAKLWRQLG
jgi:RNA polymerase sigma-70 factor (ECF subfamily)